MEKTKKVVQIYLDTSLTNISQYTYGYVIPNKFTGMASSMKESNGILTYNGKEYQIENPNSVEITIKTPHNIYTRKMSTPSVTSAYSWANSALTSVISQTNKILSSTRSLRDKVVGLPMTSPDRGKVFDELHKKAESEGASKSAASNITNISVFRSLCLSDGLKKKGFSEKHI